jgi:glyoxylase-like metal-dependent hydrolase (beta-lactamase superfamily II)
MGRDRFAIVGYGDILAVRSPLVTFYVLRRRDSLFLIDAGFVGGVRLLRETLVQAGWESLPIKGILLTHGHLDHIFNAASLAEESGAWIAAPRLDARHLEGRYPYRGYSRVCGWMEALGRGLFPWKPFSVMRWIDDGTVILEAGLKAVHLPGHTAGHTGFLDEEQRQLFSADLFASFSRGGELPPPIFNSVPGEIPGSIAKALTFPLRGILPSHGDVSSPEKHLSRLRVLAGVNFN